MSELAAEPENVWRSVMLPVDTDRGIAESGVQKGLSTNLLVLTAMKEFMEVKGYSFDPNMLNDPALDRDISRNQPNTFRGVIISSGPYSAE